MKKNFESFRSYAIDSERLKFLLGGQVGASGGTGVGVGTGPTQLSISCHITLGGGYSFDGLCSSDDLATCYSAAGNYCRTVVGSGQTSSCFISKCG